MASRYDENYIATCVFFLIALIFDIIAIVLFWEGSIVVADQPGYDAYWSVTSTIVYCIGMVLHLVALRLLQTLPPALKRVKIVQRANIEGPPMSIDSDTSPRLHSPRVGSPLVGRKKEPKTPISYFFDVAASMSTEAGDVMAMRELDEAEKAQNPRMFASGSGPDRNSLYLSAVGFLLRVAVLIMVGHLFNDGETRLGSGFYCMLGSILAGMMGSAFLSLLLYRKFPSWDLIVQSVAINILVAAIVVVCDVLALALQWFEARQSRDDVKSGFFGTTLVLDLAVVYLCVRLVSAGRGNAILENAFVLIACIILTLILRGVGFLCIIVGADSGVVTLDGFCNGGVASGIFGLLFGILHCMLNVWTRSKAKLNPRANLTFPRETTLSSV
eukprot:GEMP01033675.1.p1 GENE.GEMP01033675.1~~GEMP01033675.1.p1  ORF type:complete len:386 (+),score=72.29 GEMP01033675.1:183-1340(+)